MRFPLGTEERPGRVSPSSDIPVRDVCRGFSASPVRWPPDRAQGSDEPAARLVKDGATTQAASQPIRCGPRRGPAASRPLEAHADPAGPPGGPGGGPGGPPGLPQALLKNLAAGGVSQAPDGGHGRRPPGPQARGSRPLNVSATSLASCLGLKKRCVARSLRSAVEGPVRHVSGSRLEAEAADAGRR